MCSRRPVRRFGGVAFVAFDCRDVLNGFGAKYEKDLSSFVLIMDGLRFFGAPPAIQAEDSQGVAEFQK